MTDPLAKFPLRPQYHFPLTDDGRTWNGKVLMLPEKFGKQIIQLATLNTDGEITIKLRKHEDASR
jgi:hypothetical protein